MSVTVSCEGFIVFYLMQTPKSGSYVLCFVLVEGIQVLLFIFPQNVYYMTAINITSK